jgi:hypothetical protein
MKNRFIQLSNILTSKFTHTYSNRSIVLFEAQHRSNLIMPAHTEIRIGLSPKARHTSPMADFEARLLVDCGWAARKYPTLDAMLNVARREDGSWAIAPETIVLVVNVVTGRSLRVSTLVDFERLYDVLRLLNEYGQLALAAPYMPEWLCSLGRDDSNLLARSWRGVRVAWLTADPCRLPLCVEVMAHVSRAAADGELIDVEGMTYGSSPFALPPWLPRDISDLRTRNLNNVLWLTGKYIRDMPPSSKHSVTAGREIFKNRFIQLEQNLENAGKMASVEEVLDSIIRAHPLWTEHDALRAFIEPTNESTRISFIAAFSREEEDPSGTLLMTRFGQDICSFDP